MCEALICGEFLEQYRGVNPMIILTWTALCFLAYFLSPSLSSNFIPNFSTLSPQQKSVYGNRFTSFIHSTIMSALFLLYWLSPSSSAYATPSVLSNTSSSYFSTQNLIGNYEYFTMNIMIGYLYYDTLYELYHAVLLLPTKKLDPATIQILLHHFLGIFSHWLIQYYHSGIASIFLMGIYGAEISTPFLNVSWLLIELKLKDTKLFFINGLALLATFFWRNILGFFILYQFYALSSLWNHSTSLSDGSTSVVYDQIVFYTLLLITIFFAGLNVIWTLKLLKKAFGNDEDKKKKKK